MRDDDTISIHRKEMETCLSVRVPKSMSAAVSPCTGEASDHLSIHRITCNVITALVALAEFHSHGSKAIRMACPRHLVFGKPVRMCAGTRQYHRTNPRTKVATQMFELKSQSLTKSVSDVRLLVF